METDRKSWYTCHILFSIALILVSIFIIIDSLKMSLPLIGKGQATIQIGRASCRERVYI